MADIVVGVDGSRPAERALAWALEEACLRGDATVVAVHGYRSAEARNPYAYPYLPGPTLAELGRQERQWREEQDELARRHAEALVQDALETAGGTPERIAVKILVVPQDPARALVASTRDAELLVVGTRGLGGFAGLLLGSVSLQCLHHARCPVVVVR